jgi:hypothetical protein
MIIFVLVLGDSEVVGAGVACSRLGGFIVLETIQPQINFFRDQGPQQTCCKYVIYL